MRLLLDEMFAPAIARALRERGHDVEAVAEQPEWRAFSDADVLDVGRRERRAVVTSNLRDYRPMHRDLVSGGGAGHAGVVFVPTTYRLTKDDSGRLVTALEAVLRTYPGDEDLANGEAWL